jgi:hypothetical protein
MNLAALKAELLAGHPNEVPYDANAAIAAGQLNEPNRSQNKTSMTGSEILNAMDKDAFLALSDADKQKVWDVLHLGTVNPFGIEAEVFKVVFGVPSDTITSLIAARVKPVSRAVEIGLGTPTAGDVQRARALA